MIQNPQRQASYSRLATGTIATRRSDILLAATDTFCNRERPDNKQINQYRELFYSLIGETEEASKRLIASALARHYYPPRQVLLYLGLETAAIAAPILAYSKGLSQFDLKQIINKTSNLHHRIIANRDDLDKTVIDKLIELNDHLVLRRLRDNSALDISKQLTRKPSLGDLVETQESSEDCVNLEPVRTVVKAYKHHTSPRKEIPQPEAQNSGNAEHKVKSALEELIALANRGQRLAKTDNPPKSTPTIDRETFKKVLLEATIRKNRQDQSIAIQQRFNLSAKTVQAIFEDHSGDSLAVTLKAAALSSEAALPIIAQSLPNVGLSDHNTKRMVKIYQALDQKVCQITVNKWSDVTSQLPRTYKPATMDASQADKRTFGKRQPSTYIAAERENRKLFAS